MGQSENNKPKRAKSGGRKKGTPNKITNEMRQILASGLQERARAFFAHLDQCEHFEFCKIYSNVLPYVVPRLADATISGNIDFSAMSEEQLQTVITSVAEAISEDTE